MIIAIASQAMNVRQLHPRHRKILRSCTSQQLRANWRLRTRRRSTCQADDQRAVHAPEARIPHYSG